MTLSLDKKEDLRLRMIELEKKLAESEEERSKLEKTCNILIKAFREEEKMHYKEINKKYEKFLEDCTLRRKRNDIILKSLCRIEDRARALFAKTERLKILKDRYVSCLKISDIKKEEPVLALKNFPYSSLSQKVIHDTTPKTVHWEFPYTSDIMLGHKVKEFIETEKSSFSKYGLTNGSLLRGNKEICEDIFTPRRSLVYKKPEKDTIKYQNLWHNAFSDNRINASEKPANSEGMLENCKPEESQTSFKSTSINSGSKCGNIDNISIAQNTNFKKDFVYPMITNEKISYSRVLSSEPGEKSIDEVTAIREKVAVTHQESIEKLKKALSVEDDEFENDKFENSEETQKIIEKDEIEMNEKNQFLKNDLKTVNECVNQLVISKTDIGPSNELKNDAIDLQAENFEKTIEDKVSENLPVGLDGVDYQNETYPESYYEQPVHHNHISIASDVILEEDESEQDIDQNMPETETKITSVPILSSENESHASKINIKKTGQFSDLYPEKQLLNSSDKTNGSCNDFYEFRNDDEQLKMDFDRDDQSRKSDSIHNSEKNNKRALQSNLMHLLESDSESFQIEHGDLATGNEDSDFDFSFNQN